MTEPVDAPTETRNPRTAEIDRLSAIEIVRLLNEEDALVPGAVAAVLPELAKAVEIVAERLRAGGTMHYFGAGTSGRLGALDAAELPPTFAVPKTLVVAHHAGGTTALREAVENVEDDEASGAADAAGLTAADVAVGIAASGRTPYVRGALAKARELGAATILVTANPRAPLAAHADVHIGPDTGPEAIAGSTRLKAGTATKLVLNSLSTAVMVLLGRTYSNLMVHMLATNEKLRGRSVRILAEASGASFETCERTLADAGGDVRVALVALLAGVGTPEASDALASADGTVRAALAKLA
ncbi:MAG: N-acetylmuramic acid 6-phosphate etherase [Streptosporangiales bacterium]|nr:N-acetylmuramic acid 6-phosphate etherase [Streptosporangiales bacterium]MBO0890672.1 N-acetylmuramic acid 6-phosphate etherase [Acidothermales bacterium]